VLYGIRMIDRGIPEFKPIGKDEKNKVRQYFCVGCGGIATQTALFKIEGYCDVCASKLSQSTSDK
jgi:hypothetical protein